MDKTSRKRAEILDTALRLFSEKGYHSTRIEDIATEMNMAQGLFYRYFPSKLDIFYEVIEEIVRRITEGVMSDAPGSSDTLEEYIDQMTRGVENLFEILTDDPFLSKLLFYEPLGIDEELNRKIQDIWGLFAEFSSFYTENGIEKGILRSDIQVKETAFAFNAIVFEAVRRISQAEDKEQARASWMKAIIDLMTRGTADKASLERLDSEAGTPPA
jgi:AcrR family transcriptional regulator